MATKRSPAAAREAARKKILSKYESALESLAAFEQLNYGGKLSALETARDKAIEKAVEKAQAKYAADVSSLRLETAPVIAQLRESLSMSEVSEHTGFNRTEQKELLDLLRDSDQSEESSEQHADRDQEHDHQSHSNEHHYS